MKGNSWVIIELSTNKVLFETWSVKLVNAINTAKYKAVPILEYLVAFNKSVTDEL